MAHRYWRIDVTQSTSGPDGLLSLYEMAMAVTVGGADVCAGGVASASHGNAEAGLLVDDNTSSYWINGAPGVASWFQYDWGAGNAKQIVELRLLPRFLNQCPEDFTVQCSNDGIHWVIRGAWVGETNWTGGLWKTFLLPDPVVVPVQQSHQYGLTLVAASQRNWKQFLDALLVQPLHDSWEVGRGFVWSLQTLLVKGHQQPRVDTVSRQAKNSQPFLLLPRNPVDVDHLAYWDLSWSEMSALVASCDVCLNGRLLLLLQGTLAWSGAHAGWVARLTLGLDADFLPWQVGEPVALTWGTAHFAMRVEQKSLVRQSVDAMQRVLTLVSPCVRHELPGAVPVTRSWLETIRARDLVEELLGESVDWDLPDWRLPGGRFSVSRAAPLDVIKVVAEVVGGVVQSRPNGRLWLRHRFLYSIPDWDTANPDHVLTDAADLLAASETGSTTGSLVNRITVQEAVPDALPPYLWLGVDTTGASHNRGRSRFASGETVHLLSLAGPGVQVTALQASAGEFMPMEPAWRQVSEELIFSASNQAILSRPARSIDGVVWLGNDLGALTLQRDGRTVTASLSGVAIARVTTTLMTHGCHPFKIPNSLAGSQTFPAAMTLCASVTATTTRSVTARRHDGLRVGETIASPLLADALALQARAEAELDAGERLRMVRLTLVCRPEVEPGQLVEVHDGMYGASYRGIVTGVTHEIDATGAFTHLELLKRGQ